MNHLSAIKQMLRNGEVMRITQYQKFQNLTNEQMDKLLEQAKKEVEKEFKR